MGKQVRGQLGGGSAALTVRHHDTKLTTPDHPDLLNEQHPGHRDGDDSRQSHGEDSRAEQAAPPRTRTPAVQPVPSKVDGHGHDTTSGELLDHAAQHQLPDRKP
ncbi:hypothetical protein [Streptomyces rimosus]|uniref:hypothetical protein n=1 Tax=Streptomyces rimosus TaxID=1927 RepID=UPI0037CDA78C